MIRAFYLFFNKAIGQGRKETGIIVRTNVHATIILNHLFGDLISVPLFHLAFHSGLLFLYVIQY